jgi:hypothetical protein
VAQPQGVRIWQVTEYDNAMKFYWFATRREAMEHKRAYDADKPSPDATCEVEPVRRRISPTRIGIADAMNWVISLTCFNEN